MQRLLQK